MEKNNELICIDAPLEGLREVVFESSLDMGTDFAEIGIDMLLEEGVLKDIPIVGIGVKVTKGLVAFKNIFLTKKVLVFAQKIQKGNIDREKIQEHIDDLNRHPKKKQHEMEIILSNLDKHIKYTKNMMLGNNYLRYLSGDYDLNNFEFIAELIDGISVYDIDTLIDIYKKKRYSGEENYNSLALKRLSNLGFVQYSDNMALILEENGDDEKPCFAKITELGEMFCDDIIGSIKVYSDVDGERIIK